MRIGLLSPSVYMSPTRFGDMIFAPRDLAIALADGLVDRGHEVYFFTAPDVPTQAHLVSGDKHLLELNVELEKNAALRTERQKWASFYTDKRDYELDLILLAYQMAKSGKLDLIHSYHDTLAHFFDDLTGFPTVYTLHDPLPKKKNSLEYWLLKKFSHHDYVPISNAFKDGTELGLHFTKVVYHGINAAQYSFDLEPEKPYLAFVGRMVPEKGLHEAIQVAVELNIPLQVATSDLITNQDNAYYKEIILPAVKKAGKLITFTGFLTGKAKNEFLRKALCLLFPISWEEPFGMAMIEAMASGTPVVAYNRGSVGEIIKDGVTGFIVQSENPKSEIRNPKKILNTKYKIQKLGIAGLVEAVRRIKEIERAACRKEVEEKFSIEQMVLGYEEVYKKVKSQNAKVKNES